MKFLLDQGLPRSAAELLRQADLDTVHTGECGLPTASDRALLDFAQQEGRVIVTLDADFYTLMALSGADGPSVIRIRIEGLKGSQACSLLKTVVGRHRRDLEQGALVSVSTRQVRLRSLPIEPR